MTEIDALCEFSINFLLSGQGDARRLAAALVRKNPDHPPTEVVFILSSAAASIEEVLSGPESRTISVDAWRNAALFSVDLHMMQLMGLPHARCADVLTYWQTHDGYFLAPAQTPAQTHVQPPVPARDQGGAKG